MWESSFIPFFSSHSSPWHLRCKWRNENGRTKRDLRTEKAAFSGATGPSARNHRVRNSCHVLLDAIGAHTIFFTFGSENAQQQPEFTAAADIQHHGGLPSGVVFANQLRSPTAAAAAAPAVNVPGSPTPPSAPGGPVVAVKEEVFPFVAARMSHVCSVSALGGIAVLGFVLPHFGVTFEPPRSVSNQAELLREKQKKEYLEYVQAFARSQVEKKTVLGRQQQQQQQQQQPLSASALPPQSGSAAPSVVRLFFFSVPFPPIHRSPFLYV
jgi:hypothetical protein